MAEVAIETSTETPQPNKFRRDPEKHRAYMRLYMRKRRGSSKGNADLTQELA